MALTHARSPYSSEAIFLNPFLPTVPTFAVRETNVSRHNGGPSGAPLKPLRDDSALRALSSLSGYQTFLSDYQTFAHALSHLSGTESPPEAGYYPLVGGGSILIICPIEGSYRVG